MTPEPPMRITNDDELADFECERPRPDAIEIAADFALQKMLEALRSANRCCETMDRMQGLPRIQTIVRRALNVDANETLFWLRAYGARNTDTGFIKAVRPKYSRTLVVVSA